MSVLRVYGQWIIVTVLLGVLLFASAWRVDLPMFWIYLAVHSGGQLAMALLGFALSFALIVWAMVVNNFYSRIVRIQGDRGQYVVTEGPYRFVRHPSYVGSILSWVCAALALGSWLALMSVALIAAAVVVRTALEDRVLQAELGGYGEYTRRVRYRLVPGVW